MDQDVCNQWTEHLPSLSEGFDLIIYSADGIALILAYLSNETFKGETCLGTKLIKKRLTIL